MGKIEIKETLKFSVFFFAVFILVNVSELQQHEAQHRVIYRFYGINSTTTYEWLDLSGYTKITDENVTLITPVYISLNEMQSKAEIDGYNHLITINTMLLSVYMVGYAVLTGFEKSKKKI